jgi:hypothetical protein
MSISSSVTSYCSGVHVSTSSHCLRPVPERQALAKHPPSSSSIEHHRGDVTVPTAAAVTPRHAFQDNQKDAPAVTAKKDVTSHIASLWKKIDDSKKRNSKEKELDPRVWITQGKVISEADLVLLRMHEEQRLIVSHFQAQQQPQRTEAPAVDLKARSSKLRLSMKFLSKTKKDKETPTSPSGKSANGSVLTENRDADADSSKTKRHSRLGSFLIPEEECGAAASNGRCGAVSSSALMPPPSTAPTALRPAAANRSLSTSAVQVHRNDSYLSSMGRRNQEAGHQGQQGLTSAQKTDSTSSMVVTIV